MAPKKSKKSKKEESMIDFVEEEVTGDVDEDGFEQAEDMPDEVDSDEDEPPKKKKKVVKKEIKQELELTDEKLQELLEKYEASKATATKTKDDFKHLPKSQRGKALKRALRKDKRARQGERAQIRDELGESAPQKEVPKTIESMREYDATMVNEEDDEVEHDEANDEFAPYFNRETSPKVMITMTPKAKIVSFTSKIFKALIYHIFRQPSNSVSNFKNVFQTLKYSQERTYCSRQSSNRLKKESSLICLLYTKIERSQMELFSVICLKDLLRISKSIV